ncbi:hypothetical protein HMPREF1051_2268 [Neisseria sicca VK64]|uniref:Uncharacterized protein n=1 Tax=Neisseria sicca VK64 TaxID=1095748 RepID=I2NCR3_NEISI|nr:hypothetical protein HMPREF1051_2268 [Neisseria sicca VK64]
MRKAGCQPHFCQTNIWEDWVRIFNDEILLFDYQSSHSMWGWVLQ